MAEIFKLLKKKVHVNWKPITDMSIKEFGFKCLMTMIWSFVYDRSFGAIYSIENPVKPYQVIPKLSLYFVFLSAAAVASFMFCLKNLIDIYRFGNFKLKQLQEEAN